MNNIELEDRLAKLEKCCNEYKSQFNELREQRPGRIYEELEERLRRNYEEMNRDLRRTFERIDEQLRQVRPPERAEGAVHPEFNRDADRLAFELKLYTPIADNQRELFRNYISQKFEIMYNLILRPYNTPEIDHSKKPFMEVLFELYEKTIHVSRLYKLAGNLPLAEKYRQDAEKIYDELRQIEDMLETKWEKLQELPKGYHIPSGSIWKQTRMGRHTLLKSGSVAKFASQKASEGGRKKKTRKNKVLHKR
jgi:hypothetical protein